MLSLAEYIWIDGTDPTPQLRSKTRVLKLSEEPYLEDFPEWCCDGSSTYQSDSQNSDLIIKPVCHSPDPIRGQPNYLVMCEVFSSDGLPHPTNTRAALRKVLEAGGCEQEPFVGFEQEYTFFSGSYPLGWIEGKPPQPQGPFYCGVGNDKVFGRDIAEEHLMACLKAGLRIYGINAEVMPSQWEFQIGFRGFDSEEGNVLLYADQLWIARWLLCRLAESHNVFVCFDNKPIPGNWNGSGCHTNFSTRETRDPKRGLKAIESSIKALREKHREHIEVYGYGLEKRLTGLHETCHIEQFIAGVGNRGASVRIPLQVYQKGYGYFEDRRPGANMDPYLVTARILATVCELEASLLERDKEQLPLNLPLFF